jgi:hypothetical protein
MTRFLTVVVVIFAALGLPVATLASDEEITSISCPTSSSFMQAYKDGSLKDWPNIRLSDGIRVQLQHPKTQLIAHAKFFDGERTGFACQYYNYVGIVATAFWIDYQKSDTNDGAFWRKDYRDSLGQNGEPPNSETIEVCMVALEGDIRPSIGCNFIPSR